MDKPHKRLLAWKKSMDLVAKLYELTKLFPRDEIYGTYFPNSPSGSVSSVKHKRGRGWTLDYTISQLPINRDWIFERD